MENMVDLVVDLEDDRPKYDDPVVPDQQLSEPALDGVDQVTYSATITNDPPANEAEPVATNVTIDFDIPEEMSYVTASWSKGSCTSTGTALNCAIGELQAFEEATVDLTLVGNGSQLADAIATLQTDVKMTEKDPGGEELKAAIRATCASITSQQCHRLIASMPCRIAAVIHAKGAPTRF